MRRFLGWTFGALAALVVAALLLLIFPPTGWIAGKVEEIVAARTGYALEIGDLELDLLSGTPSATVTSVSVDGGQLPELLELGRAEVAVDLGAALGGEIVIDRALVDGATVRLLRDAEGRTSWTPGTVEAAGDAAQEIADEATEPDGGEFVLPTIRTLRIEDLTVIVDDAITDTEAELAVRASGSTLAGETPLAVAAEGVANGAPVEVDATLESALGDAISGGPVRLVADAATDGVSLDLAGGIDDPATLAGLDLALDVDVDSLDALEEALGAELPALAPATFAATVRTEGEDIVAALRGDAAGAPVSASLALGLDAPVTVLLAEGGPATVDLDATVGGASIDVLGGVEDVATLAGIDLALQAEVESLDALEALTGAELPALAPATLKATVASAEGGGYAVRADGTVDGEPVTVALDLDASLDELRAGGPIALDLDAAVGGAKVAVSGSVGDVATLADANLRLAADVESLDAVEALTGAELPDLEPATLSATVTSEGGSTLLTAEGTVDGAPVTATLALESSVQGLLAGEPVTFDLDASVGGAALGAAGRVEDPAAFAGVDLALDADIDSLGAIETLLGTSLPDVTPVTLDATLVTEGDEYVVRGLDLAAAGSALEGEVRVDPTTQPVTAYANLVAGRLDVDALLVALGDGEGDGGADDDEAGDDAGEGDAEGPILPADPLPVDLLFGAAQGAVELTVEELVYAPIPLTSFEARAELTAERATVALDEVVLAGGDVDADLSLEPVDGASSLDAKLDLDLARVQVGRFLPDIELLDDAGGLLGGQVELWASGDSVATLAGSLDGGASLLMGSGELDALLVELAGLDLFQAIGDLLVPGEKEFGLRCAYASLFADAGTVSVDNLVVDSVDTVFIARGTVDLGAETLDVALEPHPKDPSLVAANTGVAVTGTFAAPAVEVGSELTARAAVAAVLGTVATPAAALLPFIELGGGRDSGFCELEGALGGDAD